MMASRDAIEPGRAPSRTLAPDCSALTGAMRRLALGLRALVVVGLLFAVYSLPAAALDAIPVNDAADQIDISRLSENIAGRGDTLQIETAAVDGVSGRMSVRAARAGSNPSWQVFALNNTTNRPQTRWVIAERYSVMGSGVVWPDLDARRIEAITPSIGYLPERIESDRADIYRVVLEPGQIITYVVELRADRYAQIKMWQPLTYQFKARDRQLFNGVLLGIVGVLGVFLTAIFAANHRAIFPATALLTWCVLAYLCVDFGYWHKLLNLRPEDTAAHRAATEAAMAASLAIFVVIFLRLNVWYGFVRMLAGVWIAAALALVGIAILDPRLASTFARISFVAVGAVGGLLTLFLALRGQDRALHLLPVWILFLVWVFGAGLVLVGRLGGEIVISSMTAFLVLVVVLFGFVVTQFAFKSVEPRYAASPGEQQSRALAVEHANAVVWEWNARRDEVRVSNNVETSLGLAEGELSAKTDVFLRHLHPADRERLKVQLDLLKETAGGMLKAAFRLRHSDNSYRWFDLEASSVPMVDLKSLRCVGLMRDVTDERRATERLMHDAVHDSLSGLPNRQLFLDRLAGVVARSARDETVRPALLFIDIDKFKSVNSSFGLLVGDSLLLTVARRLAKHVGADDTLARLGGDQFAILLVEAREPRELAALAEDVRRSIRAPIRIAGQDVVLTGAIGIALHDADANGPSDLLKEAEIAMYRAKRGGADQIEIFRPDMRVDRDDRIAIESDLRKALEKSQIKVLYQPIIYLPTEELAGFEALVRWEHPKLGLLNPTEFVPVAEESDLIVRLGSYVLNRSVQEAIRWQKQLPRKDNPLFVSVNVSSRQLFRQDLVQEIRSITARSPLPDGTLRLEVTESLVMENPEQAAEMLGWLQAAGARLALDDFGTGYSSLAYLQRFPFDIIKIDRDIVQSSSGGGANSAIVRSIVALAHELGKKVVAEGVEAAADVGFLRSLGCEFAQGYYYGEPMEARDVIDLLKIVSKSERKIGRRGFFRTKVAATPEADSAVADKTGSATANPAGNPGGDAPEAGGSKSRPRRSDREVANGRVPTNGMGRAPSPAPQPQAAPPFAPVVQPNPQAQMAPPPSKPGSVGVSPMTAPPSGSRNGAAPPPGAVLNVNGHAPSSRPGTPAPPQVVPAGLPQPAAQTPPARPQITSPSSSARDALTPPGAPPPRPVAAPPPPNVGVSLTPHSGPIAGGAPHQANSLRDSLNGLADSAQNAPPREGAPAATPMSRPPLPSQHGSAALGATGQAPSRGIEMTQPPTQPPQPLPVAVTVTGASPDSAAPPSAAGRADQASQPQPPVLSPPKATEPDRPAAVASAAKPGPRPIEAVPASVMKNLPAGIAESLAKLAGKPIAAPAAVAKDQAAATEGAKAPASGSGDSAAPARVART